MTAENGDSRTRRDGRVTAVVFSLNEAYLLHDCLARLGDFDEILVCDMQSTDDTVAVARQYGARVLTVPHAPVIEAVRQLALDAVSSEWVLFVDADERLPAEFKACLKVAELTNDIAAVRLRYDNVAFGVPLANTLRGSAKYALLRSDLARYVSGRAHEPPALSGPVVDAPPSVPAILHLNFRSIEQSLEKVLRYAHNDPRGSATLANPLMLPREIALDVLRGGAWRDGRAGVVVVTINAVGRFHAAALEWEKNGYPDEGWSPRTRAFLVLVSSIDRTVMRLRKRLRAVRGA